MPQDMADRGKDPFDPGFKLKPSRPQGRTTGDVDIDQEIVFLFGGSRLEGNQILSDLEGDRKGEDIHTTSREGDASRQD